VAGISSRRTAPSPSSARPVRRSVSLLQATRGDRPITPIYAGRRVTVESAEMVSIYVMGKVNRRAIQYPQGQRRGDGGVAVAGGAMPDAALTNIRISHFNGEIETVSFAPPPDGSQKNPLRLKNGDLVSVTDTIPSSLSSGGSTNPASSRSGRQAGEAVGCVRDGEGCG